jgi:hypothetical protein
LEVEQGQGRSGELRRAARTRTQTGDEQVEMAVGQAIVDFTWEGTGQRPGHPDDEDSNVAGGDVGA